MASGHVNRTNRPNTWLHRPACGREESPCQLGAVHTWHFASNELCAQDVRNLGMSGLTADAKSTRMTPTRPPTPQAVAEWLACPLTGFRESPLKAGGGTYSNLLFGHRPEVGRRNAVLRCCFVGRSDPQQRWLGKRPPEEHHPHRKFCRNGPNQAHTAGSRGIADSVEHVSRETRRDGQCWKAVLADQAPDRTGACRRASRHRLDRCTQDVSGNVPRRRDQGVEVVLRHALQNDFLI